MAPESWPERIGDLRLPAYGVADLIHRGTGMDRVEAHLARVVEVVDAQVRDDDRRPATQPTLLATNSSRVLGAAEIAGRGPEVDLARRTSASTGA
jgi:hypothetical protein